MKKYILGILAVCSIFLVGFAVGTKNYSMWSTTASTTGYTITDGLTVSGTTILATPGTAGILQTLTSEKDYFSKTYGAQQLTSSAMGITVGSLNFQGKYYAEGLTVSTGGHTFGLKAVDPNNTAGALLGSYITTTGYLSMWSGSGFYMFNGLAVAAGNVAVQSGNLSASGTVGGSNLASNYNAWNMGNCQDTNTNTNSTTIDTVCSANHRVVGGGCLCNAGGATIHASYPILTTTWRCICSAADGGNYSYAICCPTN